MKNIVILGAGGFGREVQWLIDRINEREKQYNILGFIDDGVEVGTHIGNLEVIGNTEFLCDYDKSLCVVVAIGSAKIRRKVADKLKGNVKLEFPNLIDPSVLTSERSIFGKGNIICAGTILTVDYQLGDFVIINLDCTVGHDAILDSFVTLYPSVNVSGCVKIGQESEIGTGTNIIQGKNIGERSIIGAGSVVVRDIEGSCTAMGCPCKVVKAE